VLRPLIASLLLAACAAPQKVECACACPTPIPPWPEYGDRMPTYPSPFVPLGPFACPDGGANCVVFVPTVAL